MERIRKLRSSHAFWPLTWIGLIAVTLAIVVLVSNRASAPTITPPVDGSAITINGEFTCLPHKDTDGPQTLECAFGLQSGGTYYSLADSTSDYSLLSPLATGDNVTVSGTFRGNPDSKYQDIGTITVTSAKKQ